MAFNRENLLNVDTANANFASYWWGIKLSKINELLGRENPFAKPLPSSWLWSPNMLDRYALLPGLLYAVLCGGCELVGCGNAKAEK
ncbi:hypothetical protein CHUAL_003611 [Chamberlinius hualienensis]